MRPFKEGIDEHELPIKHLLFHSTPFQVRMIKWLIQDIECKRAGKASPRFPYFDDMEKAVDLFFKEGIVDQERNNLSEKGQLLKAFLHMD
jgi:hypothetical protein